MYVCMYARSTKYSTAQYLVCHQYSHLIQPTEYIHGYFWGVIQWGAENIYIHTSTLTHHSLHTHYPLPLFAPIHQLPTYVVHTYIPKHVPHPTRKTCQNTGDTGRTLETQNTQRPVHNTSRIQTNKMDSNHITDRSTKATKPRYSPELNHDRINGTIASRQAARQAGGTIKRNCHFPTPATIHGSIPSLKLHSHKAHTKIPTSNQINSDPIPPTEPCHAYQ